MIAPSILSANMLDLLSDLKDIESKGADWHHVDVMDGHYVPNLTFGPPLIQTLKSQVKIPLDVHLMISNPEETWIWYAKAGADCISFHVETINDFSGLVQSVRAFGPIKIGIAVHPDTPISSLFPHLFTIDFVLLMSVRPGFSGQSFMDSTWDRLRELNAFRTQNQLGFMIEVDGGVNESNAQQLRQHGADILVAGHFIYRSQDRLKSMNALRAQSLGSSL